MNNPKYQKRYGNYPHWNISNILLYVFVIFLIYSIIKSPQHMGYYLFFFVLVICGFISCHNHFKEEFYIEGNIIHHQEGKYQEKITIPNDAVFVISHATTNIILFKKYIINIVAEDVEVILEKLHEDEFINAKVSYRRGLFKTCTYDNEIVEGSFKNKFYYCFLYNKTYAEEFFSVQQKTIIIPRSIADKIDLDIEKFNVIIDEKA